MKASSLRTLSYFCQLFTSWMATQCFVYSRGSIDIYEIGKPVLNIVSLHYKGGPIHPIWNLRRHRGSERYRPYGESQDIPEVSLGLWALRWHWATWVDAHAQARAGRAKLGCSCGLKPWVAAEWTGSAPRQTPPISVALTSDPRAQRDGRRAAATSSAFWGCPLPRTTQESGTGEGFPVCSPTLARKEKRSRCQI